MRVLFATGSPARYMRPPQLGDEQIVCGPDWADDTAPDGRVRSLATPVGEYDLAAVAARLPAAQQPDLVVCLVDASWRNLPRNLSAFSCPRVLLMADTHHLASPLMNMLRYLMAESYDRIVLLYDRHHAPIFHAAGFHNLYWFPGLTLPHDDAAVRRARASGARATRIAFVGQSGQYHPRRARLLEALTARGLPLAAKALAQAEGLGFYGSSLLGFNASLNGDLNLRVFEILASGAALLTDRLAPGSGLAQLFTDGRELLTYGSAEELAERAAHAVAHPLETRAIGAAGAAWFDAHFSAARRRAAFQALAFDGTPVPEFAFGPEETTRVFFGGNTDRLVQAVMVYEGIQELHRTQEAVRLALDPAVPADVAEIFGTLPRVAFPTSTPERVADMAVFGREQAIAGVVVNAPRLWCWDAEEPDYDELVGAFGPSGFQLASRDVAILCFGDAVPHAQVAEAPAAMPTTEPVRPVDAKHVLVVTDDPDSGGVAQYNHTVLCGLARSGYRVSCLQTRVDNPLIAEQRTLGVTHHWLDYHTGREFGRTVTDASDALRVLQADRPDLVIFSDCCPVSNLAAREAARRLGVPYVVVEGFVGAYLASNFAAQLPMLAQQYQAARAVVAVSQENLDLLHTHFGLPLAAGQVIHYGRPAKFFAPRDEAVRARLRAEIGVPADAVVCFTAARLAAVKNHPAQIDAARALARRPGGERIHFVWAGDGEDRPSLEKSIAAAGLGGRIHLLGHRWDVADWYDAADLFVLPSDLEGMPLAIMEAMAKGLPVIATAVSGIPEELGTTGRLLTPGTRDRHALVTELADTIHAWALDPAKRAALGADSRARAETMFREGLMLERTLAAVRVALAPAAGAAAVPTEPRVPFLHVKAEGGRIECREFHCYEDRGRSTARLIQAALEGEALSAFEFAVNTGDRPGPVAAYPTFSYSTETGDYSRVCPDFLFDAWPQVQIDDYETLCAEMVAAGRREPAGNRIGWIGVPMVPAREQLVALGRTHPEAVEAIDMTWDRANPDRLASPQFLSLPDQVRRWKYLIDVEGLGWSARLKTFFFSGRVVFLAERPWKEWYFEQLQPWVHYVPVRRDLSDLLENHRRIEADPALQQAIIANARAFAEQHLTRAAAIARWRELLRMHFGPKPAAAPAGDDWSSLEAELAALTAGFATR